MPTLMYQDGAFNNQSHLTSPFYIKIQVLLDWGPLLQELELFQETLNQVNTVNYFAVGVFAAILYDTLLTLSKEVEFIWRKPFSLPKGLYLVSRYYGLASLGAAVFMSILPHRSLNSCHTFMIWYTSSGAQIIEVVVNLILILRIYALYEQSKKLLFLVLPFYLVEIALVLYSGVGAGREETKAMAALPIDISVPGCQLYIRTEPSLVLALVGAVPAFLLSIVLFGLSFYKVYQKPIISRGSLWRLGGDSELPVLVKGIFLDGIIFYLANTVVITVELILILRVHNPFEGFIPLIELLVYSLSGCHFLLNLYEIGKNQLSQTHVTSPDIIFRSLGHVFSNEHEPSGIIQESSGLDTSA